MLRVPGVNPTVDWRQPLARGLIGCWLPGLTLGRDLAGKSPTLTVRSAATFGATPEGPSLVSAGASGDDGMSGLAPDPYKFGAGGLSIYWRGVVAGQRINNNPTIAGLAYDSAGSSPFIVASIGAINNAYPQIGFRWNTAGSLVATATTTNIVNTYGIIYSFGVTYIPSASAGSVVFYNNGLSSPLAASTFGAANPATTATTSICLGVDPNSQARSPNIRTNMACFWNRVLSPVEMLAQHLNPYGFLVQAAPSIVPSRLITAVPTSRYYYDMNRSQHV